MQCATTRITHVLVFLTARWLFALRPVNYACHVYTCVLDLSSNSATRLACCAAVRVNATKSQVVKMNKEQI
uniref:Secreted protein n=1 Tax=Mesocestoides corti TaxID=53468 RepID=A0A5K3F910_MESCO